MNTWLATASLVCAVIALGHSAIGEWMIFRHMQRDSIVPVHAGPGLPEFQLRIIWATWHVVSILGVALAALLWSFASMATVPSAWLHLIAIAFAASGLLVAYATRARHPAWLGLCLIAGLTAFSQRSFV